MIKKFIGAFGPFILLFVLAAEIFGPPDFWQQFGEGFFNFWELIDKPTDEHSFSKNLGVVLALIPTTGGIVAAVLATIFYIGSVFSGKIKPVDHFLEKVFGIK